MLEDAGGIRRVVLACGFVDLHKGIDGLAQIIGSQWAAASCCFIKDLRTAPLHGQEQRRKRLTLHRSSSVS